MKLTVLVDNYTYIDQYYHGEPAACFYLEDGDRRILFDTGYSFVAATNAEKMGIDLKQVDTLVLSHGHNDHTAGFRYLEKAVDTKNWRLVAHPGCFAPKRLGEESLGAPYGLEEMRRRCRLALSAEPVRLTERLTFLGQIPRVNGFENRHPIGERLEDGQWVPDYMPEDSALVYDGDKGLFLITGCSHAGVCNMLEYAKKVTGKTQIQGVLGGFHLFQTDEVLDQTIAYFLENQIPDLYPCHCVSFKAKAKLHAAHPIHEVGVGFHLNLD